MSLIWFTAGCPDLPAGIGTDPLRLAGEEGGVGKPPDRQGGRRAFYAMLRAQRVPISAARRQNRDERIKSLLSQPKVVILSNDSGCEPGVASEVSYAGYSPQCGLQGRLRRRTNQPAGIKLLVLSPCPPFYPTSCPPKL